MEKNTDTSTADAEHDSSNHSTELDPTSSADEQTDDEPPKWRACLSQMPYLKSKLDALHLSHPEFCADITAMLTEYKYLLAAIHRIERRETQLDNTEVDSEDAEGLQHEVKERFKIREGKHHVADRVADLLHDALVEGEGREEVDMEIVDVEKSEFRVVIRTATSQWETRIPNYPKSEIDTSNTHTTEESMPAASTSLYTSSLTDSEIRLLLLLPSADPTAIIQCFLARFPIHSTPPYEALSYCWGPQDNMKEIVCNNRRIPVGPSLEGALRRLRRGDGKGVRIVWADAVCINQQDNKEKSHQVPLMGEIYTHAVQTSTYLDLSGEAAEVAPSARLVARFFEEGGRFPSDDCTQIFKWILRTCSDAENEPIRKAVERFCRNVYFTRVWCIQEVHLAKRVVGYYGEETVRMRHVKRVLSAFERIISFYGDKLPRELVARIEAYRLPMIQTTNFLCPISGKDLHTTLTYYSASFQATNPRDKVYGLLGLVAPCHAERVEVDYGKGVGEVYADAFAAACVAEDMILPLDGVEHDE